MEPKPFQSDLFERVKSPVPTASVTNHPIDSITIEHLAHNRKGFALGAVVAAEWILGKKGIYKMEDVLNL